jgi:predicted phosphodiesterase
MKLESILFLPDLHCPYHDVRAFDMFLRAGKALKPKHLVVIGDLADFYSVSSHLKDPTRTANLEWEIQEVNGALDQLDALKAKHKYYVSGNHEDRLTRYLQEKAPHLFGVVSIPDLLNLKARGWEYTPYKSQTQIGKLRLTHDVGVAGRYATHKALDTYQHSVVTGHTHRMGYIVEGNAEGEHKLSAAFGWLGDASAVDYMARCNVNKNWTLGFGHGYLNPKTGVVYVTPVPIINVDGTYSCVVNGTAYEG